MDSCNDPEDAAGLSSTTTYDAGFHRRTTSGGRQSSFEEDMDDHMLHSAYHSTDICRGCGFPRGSSVWCPITQRHHGSDELPTPHKRTPSGKNIFTRLFSKRSPKAGGTSAEVSPTSAGEARAAGLPPLSPSHQPPPSVPTTPEKKPIVDNCINNINNDTNDNNDNNNTSAKKTELPGGIVPEEAGAVAACNNSGEGDADGGDQPAVQYYCYTDENGDTYYYAAEMTETVQQRQASFHGSQNSHNNNNIAASNSNRGGAASYNNTNIVSADEVTAEGCGGGADGEEQQLGETATYIYEYVDEEGNIQRCMAEVPISAAEAATEDAQPAGEGEGDNNNTDNNNKDEGKDEKDDSDKASSTTSSKKPKTAFGAFLASVFKPKKEKSNNNKPTPNSNINSNNSSSESGISDTPAAVAAPAAVGGHVDPSALGVADDGVVSVSQNATSHDEEVEAFRNTLPDSAARKAFEKERTKLIKALVAEEEKIRKKTKKIRSEYVADLDRERRAGEYVMRSDEQKLRKAAKAGEPT